jgi:hypothetical protein
VHASGACSRPSGWQESTPRSRRRGGTGSRRDALAEAVTGPPSSGSLSQTSGRRRRRPAQGLTHRPARHTLRPRAGHPVADAHAAPVGAALARRAGHVEAGGLDAGAARSEQVRPVRQPSSGWQRSTHWPRSQTRLVGQRSLPSSMAPSQSLSKPLQARARGMLTCWQVVPMPRADGHAHAAGAHLAGDRAGHARAGAAAADDAAANLEAVEPGRPAGDVGAAAHVEDRHRHARHREGDEVAAVARVEAHLGGRAAEAVRAAGGVAGDPLAAVVAKLHVEVAAGGAGARGREHHLEVVEPVVVRAVVADVVPGHDDAVGLDVEADGVAGRLASAAGVHVGPPGRDHRLIGHREGLRRVLCSSAALKVMLPLVLR